MQPYYFMLILLAVCCYAEVGYYTSYVITDDIIISQRSKRKRYIIFILYLSMMLFGILRSENMGVDTDTYKIYWFDYAQSQSYKDLLMDITNDNGFLIISKIFCIFSNDYWIWRAYIYSITFSLYFISFVKRSRYVSLSTLIYFCTIYSMSLSLIRQALAIAIVFAAYIFLFEKGKTKAFIFCVIIAATFHKTAVICLLIVLLKPFMKKKISPVNITVATLICSMFFYIVIPFLIKIYSVTDYSGSVEKGGRNLLLFLFVVILCTSIIFRKSRLANNEKSNYMINIQSMALYIQTGALRLAIFARLKSYFSVYMAILFPDMLNIVSNKRSRLIYLTVMIILFGIYGMTLQGFPKYIMHTF